MRILGRRTPPQDRGEGRATGRRALARRLAGIALLTLATVAGIVLVSDQATLLLHLETDDHHTEQVGELERSEMNVI